LTLAIRDMAQAIQDTTLGVQEDITRLHQSFMSLRIGPFYPMSARQQAYE
jgi:hypothetical protein